MPKALDVEAFIDAAPWRFAKSMPHIPHEYIVRGQVPDEDFEAFIKLIADTGYQARWGRYLHTYLNIGEHKYWAMRGRGARKGAPLLIINRALLEDQPA
jgi:hypothetical protein